MRWQFDEPSCFFLLSCKLIACSWERSTVLMRILLFALSYKLTEKKIRKAALWKREKVLGNVRNYMLLVAHTLRSKDHRQVHTVEQSCSGTSVLPVPRTQKTVRLSQSHEIVIKLHVFFRQWCTVVICFLVFEPLWVALSQFSLQPQR